METKASPFADPIAARITDELHGMLFGSENWDKRWAVAYYVGLCVRAGFCKTGDDIRLCAERYLAGKRKITPPGTARRKKQAREQKELRKNIPTELTLAVSEVIAANLKAVQQYKDGNEKALNALLGQVMRKYKTDAIIIKELLVEAISSS
jgi:hypothetical protein